MDELQEHPSTLSSLPVSAEGGHADDRDDAAAFGAHRTRRDWPVSDGPRTPAETKAGHVNAAGHRRSPATMPGYHQRRPPRNKGMSYPADPPSVEEIVAVMRTAGDDGDGARLRALIVILWRAGLRIGEALDLAEIDLDAAHGAVLVRKGKGGRRREVGMDAWGKRRDKPAWRRR
jgi:integrase